MKAETGESSQHWGHGISCIIKNLISDLVTAKKYLTSKQSHTGFQRTDCKGFFFKTIVKGKENNSERQGRLMMWPMVCGYVSGSLASV